MAKWRMSDEEFERQHREAVRRGKERMEKEPRAESVYYDRKRNRIVVELMNGCTFTFPPELAQGLAGASPEELADVQIFEPGFTLNWETLDAQFTVLSLLEGRFGNRAWMGKLARRHRTAKAQAKTLRPTAGKTGGLRKTGS